MTKLTPFWKLLECRHDRTAVLAEWKQRAGGVFNAIRPLLAPTGKLSDSYPHPKPQGLPLHVVKHKNDTMVAICREDSDIRVLIGKCDIATYCVNMEKLRKTLADALALSVARETLVENVDYLIVGKYKPKPAADFPVYMVLAKKRSFATIVRDLCDLQKPFILLATSLDCCTEAIFGLIEKKKSVVIPLDDVVECTDGQWGALAQFKDYLLAFAEKVNPKARSNFANKPGKTGKKVAANVLKLKETLIEHINGQRDRINSQIDRGYDPEPAFILEKQELGKMVGIKPDAVTRAFNKDPFLTKLHNISFSNDEILKYSKHLKA